MVYDRLRSTRSFFRRLHIAGVGAPGRRSALFILSAALLSGIASGQTPTTTALPYLLTNQGGVIVVTSANPVLKVPPAVSGSAFSSLLGGGFSSVFTTPTASTASASATASIRSLLMLKKANSLQSNFAKMQQDDQIAQQNVRNNDPSAFVCEENFDAVRFKHHSKAAKFNGRSRTADSGSCTLPEEEQAQEAEEELQSLNEAGNASQDAMEAAEQAAEAAEAAAEAAETAAEAALDAIDVLEGLIDALALV